MMHSNSLTHAMSEKGSLSDRMEPTSDHSSKSPESCCKSESEKLLADACRLVLKHASRNYMGDRLSSQSAYDIKQGLALLLSRYEISAKT